MRRRYHAQHGSSTEAINVTPLIDVVMCLIIFFLIVSKMAADQLAGVNLPRSSSGETVDSAEAVVVNIAPSRGSTSTFNGQPLRVAVGTRLVADELELESLLRQRADESATRSTAPDKPAVRSSVPVRIRADVELPYASVQPALRVCQRLGLVAVRLVTEKTGESPAGSAP